MLKKKPGSLKKDEYPQCSEPKVQVTLKHSLPAQEVVSGRYRKLVLGPRFSNPHEGRQKETTRRETNGDTGAKEPT